jgi:hypothetical protein
MGKKLTGKDGFGDLASGAGTAILEVRSYARLSHCSTVDSGSPGAVGYIKLWRSYSALSECAFECLNVNENLLDLF